MIKVIVLWLDKRYDLKFILISKIVNLLFGRRNYEIFEYNEKIIYVKVGYILYLKWGNINSYLYFLFGYKVK